MTEHAAIAAMSSRRRWTDAELLASAGVLGAVLVVGLATVRHYGITTDEFLFDDFGPKMLDWYVGGFKTTHRYDDEGIVFYGPWFQILVTFAQSLTAADRFDVRHAMTFIVGLGGLAAVVPIGRLAVGRWAGFTALVLCLLTGNLYGHLFFSPNDVPFLAAMTWATLAILVMTRREVPSWPATVCAGLLTGLAIATRVGGVITQGYLAAAIVLLALEPLLRDGRAAGRTPCRLGLRAASALVIGWTVAFALWPFVQTAHPLDQFAAALAFFAKVQLEFPFHHWGRVVFANALPLDYVPGQLAARLPEGFVILLVGAIGLGGAAAWMFVAECRRAAGRRGFAGLAAPLLGLARSRGLLVVALAALAPIAIVMVTRPTLFDGIRHLLFVVPMLAVLAAWALRRLAPLIRRFPIAAAAIVAAQVVPTLVVLWMLHPLEYVATNAFAGGTSWSWGRFDLDYWCAAATEAIRRLERRLAENPSGEFAARPPRVLVCIPWREHLAAPMFRADWILETDPGKADFVIETERAHCATGGRVIDEVRRFDRAFAWTVARRF